MTKAVSDILRRKRREYLNRAAEHDRVADECERRAAESRRMAQEARNLHCQCGAAIQQMEGDDAVLDLPEDRTVTMQATSSAWT